MKAETDPTIRRLRAETDHCQDCGMNMHEPDYDLYHAKGVCRVCYPLTCTLCGHTGPDVDTHYQYVGGQGMQSIPAACDDIDACQSRRVAKVVQEVK